MNVTMTMPFRYSDYQLHYDDDYTKLGVPSGKCQRGELGCYVLECVSCYLAVHYKISQRLVDFLQTKVRVSDSKGLLKEGLFWKNDQTIIFNNFHPNLKQYLAMF